MRIRGLIVLIAPFAVSLSGCGSIEAAYDTTLTRGAEYYDSALQGAIDFKCKIASGGALTRRYMRTDETWKMWTDECLPEGGRVMPGLPSEPTSTLEVPTS